MMSGAPAIELDGISKTYGPVRALEDVSLRVEPGEVRALMGENGAGKSTLLKILTGAIRPDHGVVRVFGEAIDPKKHSPKHARDLGVAIVHQEFSLIPSLSVAENIFLGHEEARFGVLDTSTMLERSAELLKRVHSDVSPKALVGTLGVAEAQLVEIAKALASDVRVIALDEPSAVLSGEELESLFRVVRGLAAAGVAVLYVSHRIEEVFSLCSSFAVLKDGRNSGAGQLDGTTPEDLISLMVGRSITQLFPPSNGSVGSVILQAHALEVAGLVAPVDLTLRAGQIVGLAGLQGSGRSRLARGLFGDVPIVGGELRLHGDLIRLRVPGDAMHRRIAYLPEDRKRAGLALQKPVALNTSMLSWRRLAARTGIIRRRAERDLVRAAVERLSIKTRADGRADVGTLSGGNQQKVVIAKWLELLPDVIIFDEPTRGVDVGSKEQIYLILRELADSGKAILLISSELIEVLGLSDRILVMADGEVVGELPGHTTGEEDVMRLIASHKPSSKEAVTT